MVTLLSLPRNADLLLTDVMAVAKVAVSVAVSAP